MLASSVHEARVIACYRSRSLWDMQVLEATIMLWHALVYINAYLPGNFSLTSSTTQAPRSNSNNPTTTQIDLKMCFYIASYVHCGHHKKIPADTFECTCTPSTEMKPINTPTDATNGEAKKKKKKRKNHGEFKGELRPLKEGYCPTCLVDQKAKLFDQIGSSADGLGRVLSQVVIRDEPQPIPPKLQQHANKAITTGDYKNGQSAPAATNGTDIKIPQDAKAKVPKWDLKWDGKTRNQIKREIREKKMEMVDEIRVLREHVARMGGNMGKVEEEIRLRIVARSNLEYTERRVKEMKRKENMEKLAAEIEKIRVKKMEEKADRMRRDFEREEKKKKARVLYCV
jgi:hypothetical protein